MSRTARIQSNTGVYHVMLRGINRQDLFLDEQDYRKMTNILMQTVMPMEDNGNMLPSTCSIYAWCLMSNHIHLLIQEKTEPIGSILQRIEISYAAYYNKKYGRESSLFHGRFRSEPCNGYDYFWRLLRYIHRNPVNAGIVKKPEHYKWSSWSEFTYEDTAFPTIANVSVVKRQMQRFGHSMQDLTDYIHLADDGEEDTFIEMPLRYRYEIPKDEIIWNEIYNLSGAKDPTSFQQLDRQIQKEIFAKLKKMGVQIKQIQRLTGVGRNIIQRA